MLINILSRIIAILSPSLIKRNMKNKFSLLLASIAVILIVWIGGCAKDGATGPAGPTGPTGTTGPALTGSLTGFVTTYDQYNYKVAADQGGVLLTIDNTTDSAITDATGKYTFSNLTTGIYTVTITKANYSTYKVIDIGVVGGGSTLRNIGISRPPYFGLVNVNDTVENTVANGPGILVRGNDTADISARSYIIFASTASTVSSTPANFIYYVGATIKAGATAFSQYVTSRELNDAGIASGTTVYMAVYPISTGFLSYTDLATGRPFFTAIGTTPTLLNAIVP